MSIWKRAKKSLLAAVTLIGLMPALVLANNTPRFNQLDGDREFMMGRNLTQNQVDYSDPVSATDDDVVRVSFYYHNNASQTDGTAGTPAINTRIKLVIPTDDANSHYLTGTLGADNAETVSGTIVNGQEVGQPGLTINTDNVTTVSLVAGSVRFYPNGSTVPVTLPGGQTGDEIVTGNGLNLGDINGCWQFAGFVTVDVKINPAGQPEIVRHKDAVNVSQGGAMAADVNAKPGDVIEYTLTTQNTGNRPATAVAITDDLADVLEYANVIAISDGGQLSGSSLSYDPVDLAAGATVSRTFRVQIKPASAWPAAGNLTATNIYGNRIDVPIQPPAVTPGLSIDKLVKNITQTFDFRDEVTAHRGDLVEFKIKVTNTGDTLDRNVNIKDLLPAGLNFVPGSVRLDRNGSTFAISDEVVTVGGFTLDSPLKAHEEIMIYLRATVGTDVNDGQKVRNVATASADEVGQVSDDASVKVEVPTTPSTPAIDNPAPTNPSNPAAPITPVLPITGPADLALFLLTGGYSTAASLRYYRAKQAHNRASRLIAVL